MVQHFALTSTGGYNVGSNSGFYHNQIGTIHGSNTKRRVNCDYDIYSSNAKLVVYIIVYCYRKYAKDSKEFKYIYQVYIFLSCFFLSIYTYIINRKELK